MDQSPPKRITRARAAARTDNNSGLQTTKVATAASKAKLTRSASTTKRRTRADDEHEEAEEQKTQSDEIIEPEPKATRGRARKPVQPDSMQEEDPAPVRVARGRPKKVVLETPAPEPTRTTRGRQKKLEIEEQPNVVEEIIKRPTRARAATVSKAAAPKKSVKFEEPDKENIVPIVAKDNKIKVAETATGLRAKPVRKPVAAPRTTRGRAKNVGEEKQDKSSPLSPKKPTQVASSKESTSDDELATNEKTPMRPLMKSPIKPPGNILASVTKPDFTTSLAVNRTATSEQQDLKNSILASPARRPPPSPFKENLKTSPQRIPLGGSMLQSPFKFSTGGSKGPTTNSPLKASLLASPARRPLSPMKVSETGSPSRSTVKNTLTFATTPKASTFKISRFATPRTLTNSVSRSGMMLPPALPSNLLSETPVPSEPLSLMADSSMSFSGRLSSIVPREKDATPEALESVTKEETEVQSTFAMETEIPEIPVAKPDTIVVLDDEMDLENPIPSFMSYPVHELSREAFNFRERDTNQFGDSDSEDELASDAPEYSPIPFAVLQTASTQRSLPVTPAPFSAVTKTPITARAIIQNRSQIGFTPLAKQLSGWMTTIPTPTDGNVSCEGDKTAMASSPMKNTFFDDEMSVRDEMVKSLKPEFMESDLMENFEPVALEDEDIALALEADEMSLLEPDEIDALVAEETLQAEEFAPDEVQVSDEEFQAEGYSSDELPHVEDATHSEASQEYGDENVVPVDPALLALSASQSQLVTVNQNTATPKRILSERILHTVCKVPLKPAAEDTPMRPSPKKRSASISRLPNQRPTSTLSRSNTVISYSPTKSTPRARPIQQPLDVSMQDIIATPSKGNIADWSTLGTPARTPRRDLNVALLKGAVVFVDVHTTEGADASVLFTELLVQMGARCVRNWTWNGNGEEGSKIGITHVVFKDGGKRTLEKVREANGVVSCVGVGWVLEYV
jgi:hypothetical protein